MFPNFAAQQSYNTNQIGGTPSAVLHLFSPRLFSDQGKRPIAYQFNAHFTDQAIDAVYHRATTNSGSRIDTLVANPNFMGAMIPQAMPDHLIRMEQLSFFWTFMLIINNDKMGLGGLVRSVADNMQLVYGYFLEEPINPVHHLGHLTINPNAQMIITHKTMVNRHSSVGAYGTHQRLDTMYDIDVVPTQPLAALANMPLAAMRPEDLYNKISLGGGGEFTIMHDESQLMHVMNQPLEMYSKLAVPKQNIKKILDASADALASINASVFEGSALQSLQADAYDDLIRQNLSDGARGIETGLSVHRLYTLGTIMEKYNPKINPVNLPYHQPYDIQNQAEGSAKNVFASMLATVLPAMMADFVLARICFRYNSHANALEIQGVDPITAMSEEELRKRVNAFIFRMQSELFPIMVQAHGDFDLQINCDCCNVTHINLNFLSDSFKSPEIFEVPTLLGGFNNPLIGSANIIQHNTTELGSFLNTVNEDSRDVPLSQYDRQSYNRSLDNYDQKLPNTLRDEDDGFSTSSYRWQV